MREDEANFIGYLACIGSDDRGVSIQRISRLAGCMPGNALAKADFEGSIAACMRQLDPKAIEDLGRKQPCSGISFEGTIAEVSTKVNDTYLKAHSQTDGVKSYGRMVDLMLADYYPDAAAD